MNKMNQEITKIIQTFPYIIWDMDGTLLNSMSYWDNLSSDYIKSKGLTPSADINKIVSAMTLDESAAYFRRTYLPELSESVIIEEILGLIEEEYRTIIPTKQNAQQLVEAAAKAGSRMCVLTTSDKELATAALNRVGLMPYFEVILTAQELGMDKRSGKIYEETAKIQGYDMEQTLICEDALYAVRGASETKAKVMAFRDEQSAEDWKVICETADYICQ